jgi:hypothetical protein
MTGIVGATWEMYETLTTIGWSAVAGVDPVALQTGGRLDELSSALAHDIALQHPVAPDVYGFGKQVSWQLLFVKAVVAIAVVLVSRSWSLYCYCTS